MTRFLAGSSTDFRNVCRGRRHGVVDDHHHRREQGCDDFENNVNNSNGAGPAMFAGTNGMDSPRRGLLDFAIAGNIPAGSSITSVQLTLFLAQVAGADATPRTIDLNALTANWGEGTTGMGSGVGGSGQGFAANPGDATWNAAFFPGTLWASAGATFAALASASTLVSQTINGAYVWSSTAALVGDVQQWLDSPVSNFGWALVNADEMTATDFRAFYTARFQRSQSSSTAHHYLRGSSGARAGIYLPAGDCDDELICGTAASWHAWRRKRLEPISQSNAGAKARSGSQFEARGAPFSRA